MREPGADVSNLLKYFSFKGRANRQHFWMTALLLLVFFVIGAMLTLGMGRLAPFLAILFIPILLAFYVAVLANGARRLHDRDKSAWWLLLFFVLPTILGLPARLASYSDSEGLRAVAGLLALVGLPFSIWAFVEMGCMQGTTGPNKYGDDPLQPPAEVFA